MRQAAIIAAIASPPWLSPPWLWGWRTPPAPRRKVLSGPHRRDGRAGDARLDRPTSSAACWPTACRRQLGQPVFVVRTSRRQRHPRHRRCRPRQARRLHADARRRVFGHRAAADRKDTGYTAEIVRRRSARPSRTTRSSWRGRRHLQDRGRHRRGGKAKPAA